MAEAPIFGTADGQVIRVDTSVSFQWVPDPGNAYTQSNAFLSVDDFGNWSYPVTTTTGPSTASGTVTFVGVSSSEPFTASATNLSFALSSGWRVGQWSLYPQANDWTYDPATGVLGTTAAGSWDDWIGVFFSAASATVATAHWSGDTSDTETGHWALVPDIHDVDVFAGPGNETIYGGQGTEVLSGGAGDDVIYAGLGDQTVLGGQGNDAIHGGIGRQVLVAGQGNDTIWAGTGPQTVIGTTGNERIVGGWGADTLWGGSGNDTIRAGSGPQILSGGDGNDVLYAGAGNDTLTGGAGRDVFAFDSAASGRDVITDFRLGQDVLQVARNLGGLAIARPADLASRLSAGAAGAVLNLDSETTVTLLGVSAQLLRTHAAAAFRIV